MKRSLLLVAVLALGSLTYPAHAQRGVLGQRTQDPIQGNLFQPEFVIEHQDAIDLTDAQREVIRDEALAAQTQFATLQWDMREATLAMRKLVQQPRVDEAELLAQLDVILDLERAIKRTQLTLAARIKNQLTPRQQQQLRALRREQQR